MPMDTLQPITPEAKPEIESTGNVADNGAPIDAFKIEGYFGITNATSEDARNLNEIYRMLGVGQRDIVDVLWDLKSVEARIGTPALGVSRLQHLTNYLKIDAQINSLEKERALYGA